MDIGEFLKSLILQLPNFAGLLVCVFVLIWVITKQQAQIEALQNRINELCDEDVGKT